MSDTTFINICKKMITKYHNENSEYMLVAKDDIEIIWCCNVLEHWKALLKIIPPNNEYYEIIYDGYCGTLYLNIYNMKGYIESNIEF